LLPLWGRVLEPNGGRDWQRASFSAKAVSRNRTP